MPRARTSRRALLVWAIVAIDLVAIVAAAVGGPGLDLGENVAFGLIFGSIVGSFGAVGAILLLRLPGNPIGWIYWLSATAIAWSLAAVTWVQLDVAGHPGTVSAVDLGLAVIASVDLVPVIGVIGVFVPLLFPTGRLPDRRWRGVAWFSAFAVAVASVYAALVPGPMSGGAELDNPIGVEALAPYSDVLGAVAIGSLLVAFVLAAASVVWRYRRAPTVERQQLRWFAVSVLVMVVAVTLGLSSIGPFAEIGWIVMFVGLGLVPVATGVAILRYRLYELDRLVSRTLAYGLLTGVLVAVYGALTLVLSGPLGAVTGGGNVSVAISTLIVAALFQPIRGRIQRIVDRRFDRARYDAERTSAAFSERLRDEVDMPTLITELDATVRRSISPSFVGIWMRKGSSR